MNNHPARAPSEEHLKILSICHYVNAGLGLFGVGIIVVYFFFIEMMISDPDRFGGSGAQMPEDMEAFAMVMRLILGFALLIVIAALAANVLAARWLRARRNRSFCIVVSAWNCLNVPLGTVLGVFTLITLMKPEVRESFD